MTLSDSDDGIISLQSLQENYIIICACGAVIRNKGAPYDVGMGGL